jgi:predicted transcriptional regulator
MRRRTRDHDAVGARARSVLEVILRLGDATGPQILEELPAIPSYSALRSILRALEDKGLVQHRAKDLKYVYRATVSKSVTSRRVLARVLDTYFGGQPEHAMKALLDLSRDKNHQIDFDALQRLIDQARREGR